MLLPAHSPARIPPCPPLVQERRPAPICHPLCEGVPPGLGLGASQASVRIQGQAGVAVPTSRSELGARSSRRHAAFSSNLSSAWPPVRGLGASPGPGSVPASSLGTTLQLSPPSGRPSVEGFYKNPNTKSRGLFARTPENSRKVCAHVRVPEPQNRSASLSTFPTLTHPASPGGGTSKTQTLPAPETPSPEVGLLSDPAWKACTPHLVRATSFY